MKRLRALLQFMSWPYRRVVTGDMAKKDIVLDYLIIENASITDCDLHYGGGDLHCVNVNFDHCQWHFYGKAGSALGLMKKIWEMPGGKDLILNTFPGMKPE